jgi:hypothetical protein
MGTPGEVRVSASTRLPRKPHAEKPREGESIRRRGSADLNNGWLARHGTLFLTDERLVFSPTPLDRLMGAKRREILLDQIVELERWPVSPGGMSPGGKRPRLLIHDHECQYQILVSDLDSWYDTIELIYHRRAKKGRNHVPKFTREGIENTLIYDD